MLCVCGHVSSRYNWKTGSVFVAMLSLDIIGRLCSVFVAMLSLDTIGRLALCLWPCYLLI